MLRVLHVDALVCLYETVRLPNSWMKIAQLCCFLITWARKRVSLGQVVLYVESGLEGVSSTALRRTASVASFSAVSTPLIPRVRSRSRSFWDKQDVHSSAHLESHCYKFRQFSFWMSKWFDNCCRFLLQISEKAISQFAPTLPLSEVIVMNSVGIMLHEISRTWWVRFVATWNSLHLMQALHG